MEKLEHSRLTAKASIDSEQDKKPLVIDNDFEDRYSRLRLIPWWDQDKLSRARIMVVGAGALGNEILKNLALLGIGNILIIDMDSIENSNLSRSILYREENEGACKAEIAAAAVTSINPDCRTAWLQADVNYGVGLGLFRWADVVLGGLDNREARLAINQACWKVGTPWIDGAIEALFGIARVFVPPDGACYECTMNDNDYRLLNLRKSCSLLTRNEMVSGKVPTTPTSASIIAGVQVQEAVKLIHQRTDLPTLAGKGWFYNGLTHDSYVVEYPRRESCLSHESYEFIKALPLSVFDTTAGQMLELFREEIGPEAVILLEYDLVSGLECGNCRVYASLFKPLGSLSETEARCADCGKMRSPQLTQQIAGSEAFLKLTLAEIGIPPFEIITGVNGDTICHLELTGDAPKVLPGLEF